VILFGWGTAPAQTVKQVWRLVDSQGKTQFTDQVSEEDIRSGRAVPLEVPAPTPAMQAEAQRRRDKSQQEIDRYNQTLNQKLDRRSMAARQTDLAYQRLLTAQQTYANGEEPRPGERSSSRWGSRLNNQYFARRRNEQKQVDLATRELQRAQAAQAAVP
jgi:hypothetical protein